MGRQLSFAGFDWRRPDSRGWVLLPLAFLFLLYFFNRCAVGGYHDSLSFLADASGGFSSATNATSHFLYNNLLHLSLVFFPFLSPPFALVLFSICFSVLALYRLYQILLLIHDDRGVAAFCILIPGTAFTFWQQAEIIEVYAFSNFLFLSFLYAVFKGYFGKSRVSGTQSMLICGAWLFIMLITHIQHVLTIPFYAWYCFFSQKSTPSNSFSGPAFSLRILIFLLPLLLAGLVLVLPVLTGSGQAFSEIFFDRQFQSNVLSLDLRALGTGVLLGLAFLIYNFHFFLFLLIPGGKLLFRNRALLIPFLILFLPYAGFAVKYSVDDSHVFWLVSYLILMIPMSYGVKVLWSKIVSRWLFALFLSPLIYLSVWQGALLLQHPKLEAYHIAKAYKGGIAHIFWPGKAGIGEDIFKLAREISKLGGKESEVEWNIEETQKYLVNLGE